MSDEPLPHSDLVLYQTEDGRTRIQCRFEKETVWLSLNQTANLFQRDKSVISRHIKNVFEEGELSPAATVAKSATVQTEGVKQVTREIEFYNLDAIISVGYRVKSQRGVCTLGEPTAVSPQLLRAPRTCVSGWRRLWSWLPARGRGRRRGFRGAV
jgi:hypothetical protein